MTKISFCTVKGNIEITIRFSVISLNSSNLSAKYVITIEILKSIQDSAKTKGLSYNLQINK